MPTEPLGLLTSLVSTVPIALVIGLLIHLSLAVLIDDPEASASLRGVKEGGRATWVTTLMMLGVSFVLAFLVAWLLPFRLTHNDGVDVLSLLAVGVLAGVTPWLYWLDWRLHRLPDRIVVPALALVTLLMVGALVLAFVDGSGSGVVIRALVMGAIAFAFFLLLAVLPLLVSGGRVSALGFGDVKLAPMCGLLLGLAGWGTGLFGFILTTLIAAAYAGWLVSAKRGTLRSRIAYGPFMLIGTWAATLLSTLFA